MTDEQIALSHRAVACKSWRWMPGMLAWRPDCPPVRLTAIEDAGNALQENGWLPDLTDPATLGCLIFLFQEIYNKKIVASIGNGWWSIQTDYQDWDQDNTSSILEALTLAMESR